MGCFVVHIDTEPFEEEGLDPTDEGFEAVIGDALRYLHKGNEAMRWRVTRVQVSGAMG